MDAVHLLTRAEIRQRATSLVVLAVTTAFVVGTLLAVTAGARRTTTVLDRFLAGTHASDTYLGFYWPAVADDPDEVVAMLQTLRALDGVIAAEAHAQVPVKLDTASDFFVRTPYDTSGHIDRPVIVAGRLPEPGRPHEVAVNELAAAELGLAVGDRITGPTVSPGTAARSIEDYFEESFPDDGPTVRLDVVGIVRELDDLSPTGTENPVAIGTAAFHEEYAGASRFSTLFRLRTDPRSFDREVAIGSIEARVPLGAEVFAGDSEDFANSPRTAFDAIATGLVVFAVVGATVGLLVLALVVVRHVQAGRQERRVANTLGVGRRTSAAAVVATLTLALVPGVAAGAIGAYLASGLFPHGVARRAEIDLGLRFDPVVHVGAAALVALVLVAASAVVTWRQVAVDDAVERPTTGRLTRLRRTLRPPIADGCSTVLWRAGRSTSVRPWTAVAGAVIGVGGIVGIAVFERTRSDTTADPAAYGTTWDVQPDVLSGDPMAVVEALAADPRVEAVGGVFCGHPVIAGERTQLCAYEIFTGSITPTVLDGRTPSSPTEIAVGSLTAARLDVEVGSTVDLVALGGEPVQLSVVGVVVNPDSGDSPIPGEGAVMTPAGLEQVAGGLFDQPYQSLVISLPDGPDVQSTADALADDHPLGIGPYSFAQPPGDLVQLGRMRPSLIALAWFLGGLGAIGLTHYLVLSGRRRQGEIAVLRALGFVRGQVFESTAAQAVTVATIGVLVGVPLGLIGGRWTWTFAVRDLGMRAEPVTPTAILSVVVAATIVGSVLVAVLPTVRTVRTRPSDALREE